MMGQERRGTIMKRQKLIIRHRDLSLQLEKEGMTREAASQEAYERIVNKKEGAR